MGYRPMEKSMAAANIDRMITKQEKIDNERGNCSSETLTSQTQMVNELVSTYQLDADDAYTFTRDRQFAESLSGLPLV